MNLADYQALLTRLGKKGWNHELSQKLLLTSDVQFVFKQENALHGNDPCNHIGLGEVAPQLAMFDGSINNTRPNYCNILFYR